MVTNLKWRVFSANGGILGDNIVETIGQRGPRIYNFRAIIESENHKIEYGLDF